MHRSLVTHEDPERDIIWVVKKNVSVLRALNAWLLRNWAPVIN